MRLAFIHIFQTGQFDSLPDMKNNVAKLTAGMKRTVTKVIQEWSVTCEEGKSPIGFPVFKRIYQLMTASVSAEHVYAK